MVEKSQCVSCGTLLEPADGPGRPAAYCGPACRRFAEFKIRALTRRIDRNELELRELRCGTSGLDLEDDEGRKRARWLRRWIREDERALLVLLGGPAAGASGAPGARGAA